MLLELKAVSETCILLSWKCIMLLELKAVSETCIMQVVFRNPPDS
jgi:hypothetical protein